MNITLSDIKKKKQRLEEIKKELKTELFGIDEVIDKVVESIKTWYLIPEIISHPIIINLFGLTGTGKTQLVRSLVRKLGFNHRFVEIQMDMDSNTSSSTRHSKLCEIIQASSIQEGEAGVIFLDEFQRFRTIDEGGAEMEPERFQDTWQLLSDGKFPIDYTYYETLIMSLAQHEYSNEYDYETKKEKAAKQKRKYKIYPYQAQSLKRLFRLKESIEEIMTWDDKRVHQLRMERFDKVSENECIDYSKCLIFISGNLDEAFYIAKNVNDCDTDADTFHEMTKKINTNDIKRTLNRRFKPEQIARLGNNIILYPSLSRQTYEKIIYTTCNKYINKIEENSGIKFELDDSVYSVVYANSVYPTQGTRPVFSSIHKIFAAPLSDCVLWAMENKLKKVVISLNGKEKLLTCSNGSKKIDIAVDLEIDDIKAGNSVNFKSMVAVHEAGHAVAFTVLEKTCPMEIDINVSSFTGGYTFVKNYKSTHKKDTLNRIIVLLSGIAAEEIVFGSDFRSVGCERDIEMATGLAGQYVRSWGFSGTTAKMFDDSTCHFHRADWKESNKEIENILKTCKKQAINLLKNNRQFFRETFTSLIEGNIKQKEEKYFELAKKYVSGLTLGMKDVSVDYNKMLKDF